MIAIEAMRLTKRFGGTTALDQVSFQVEEGDAVALIGPNGAGKTTLLRVLATLTKPDGGHANVDGLDGRFQASRIRRRLGYMPDVFGMYDDLDVTGYLEFFAGIHGVHGDRRAATVRDLIALLDLTEIRDRPTSALSRGMQQRVGLARTLIHDPPILLLDEPAANLDPFSRIEIREVLKELRRMGKTLLISSHILSELGEICNKLLCLDRGRVLYQGSIADIAEVIHPYKEVAVRVDGEKGRLEKALEEREEVESIGEEDGEIRVRLKEGVADFSFVVRVAVEGGVTLLGLREVEPSLEEVFVRLTRGEESP